MDETNMTTNIEPDRPDSAPDGGEGFDIKRELYDWAQAIVTAIVFVVILFTFFVRVTGIKGPSMLPTLHQDDKVLLSNMFYTPERGDIIVLTKKSFMKDPIVKRVIATEGDTLFFDSVRYELLVNGKAVEEPYINETMQSGGAILSEPVIVPEGCVFVMGDNRNNSRDSRDPLVGMVDTRYILGRLVIRVFPFGSFGPVG